MVREFRRHPTRRLVILGDPGMGKTTLAVLLLRELLAHPDGAEPVPVLLSMSGWDPGAESLHTWLARRIAEGYPALHAADFGPDAVRALVDQRRIPSPAASCSGSPQASFTASGNRADGTW